MPLISALKIKSFPKKVPITFSPIVAVNAGKLEDFRTSSEIPAALFDEIMDTHTPKTPQVDLKPIFQLVQNICLGADGSLKVTYGKSDDVPKFDDGMSQVLDDIHETSCKVSCNRSGDIGKTAMEVLHVLASYDWSAKVVLVTAAFALLFGVFCMLARLETENPFAKSLDLLRGYPQVPDFTVVNKFLKTVKALLDTNFNFLKPPVCDYMSEAEHPKAKDAINYFPKATYQIIRGIVHLSSILGKNVDFGHIGLTMSSIEEEFAKINAVLKDKSENLKLEEEDMESSISVIEENKYGEATKIRHFIHDQHDLVLKETIIMNTLGDGLCHGCMLFISTPFYHCLQCDFLLHKACAKLPKTKHHWYHQFLTNLKSAELFKCSLCQHYCSGFFYESRFNYELLKFCLRCVAIPYKLECEGHKHYLLFDSRCKEKCNDCGGSSNYGAFRCKDCNFTLDFACVTLPPVVRHKCDDHLLKLAYHDESDEEQLYCHICEKRRDRNLWYYHCTTCDKSAHTICVLGKYPFIKSGSTFYSSSHHHALNFTRRNYEYPDFCHICYSHCGDQFLNCTSCDYVQCIHHFEFDSRSDTGLGN